LPKTAAGTPGEWIIIPFDVDGGAPKFRGSVGLVEVNLSAVFPKFDRKDSRAIVVKATAPGTYTLEAWNAKADAVSEISVCTITVAASQAPARATTAAAGKYVFLVIRPNDSNAAEYEAYLANEGWRELTAAGHKTKLMTVSEAAAYGIRFGTAPNQSPIDVPYGTPLPLILTLQTTEQGKTRLVRGAIALPAPAEVPNVLPK
jgi:hypothetical protein